MTEDSKIFVKDLTQALLASSGNKALNTNSFISMGLFITILVGTLTIANSIYTAKGEINTRLDRVEYQQAEAAKKTADWNLMDMFKWAVRLQRDNQQIKVPEVKHE